MPSQKKRPFKMAYFLEGEFANEFQEKCGIEVLMLTLKACVEHIKTRHKKNKIDFMISAKK